MLSTWRHRFLARQFAHPSGRLGRWLVGPWLDRIGREMNCLAFGELAIRRGDRVVEVGFGGGELVSRMLAAGAEVIAIDRSEAMLARARRRFAGALREGRLALHHASVERLPVADRSVDRVCSVNALYFWTDLEAAIRELARLLRPGGMLVLCFQTAEAVRRWPGHRHGFIAYSAEQVQAAMVATRLLLAGKAQGRDDRVGDYVCLKGVRDG